LTIRFADLCIEDHLEIRLNGTALPVKSAEITDFQGASIKGTHRFKQLRGSTDAPEGFTGHWFRYKLDIEILKRGHNILEVKATELEKTAGFTRSLNGVEIRTRYKDFVRPEGLEGERVMVNSG